MNIEIANRLVELRKKSGLSQEQLADKLGLSRQAVSKWERAEASPDTDNLICLAQIYGVSLDSLLKTADSVDEIVSEQVKPAEAAKPVENPTPSVTEAPKTESKWSYDCYKKYEPTTDAEIKRDRKLRKAESVMTSVTALLAIIAYLLVCFFFPRLWASLWVLFLLIPIVSTLIEAVRKRDPAIFAFPVVVVIAYICIGFYANLWHPGWVVFLTIPIYYTITSLANHDVDKEIDKEIEKESKKNKDDDDDQEKGC